MKYFVIFVTALLLLTSCIDRASDKTSHDEPQKLEDIAYDVDASHGYTVYIKENEEYIPYLVLTNDYGGHCLLLRKFLINEPMLYNNLYDGIDKPSYYENCEIDKYLNTDFINLLSANFTAMISDTNLQITAEASIGRCGEDITQIIRKVFLLSLNEVQLYTSSVMLVEGKKLSYFKDNDSRIATTHEGVPQNWYLRTPDTWDRDVIAYVDINGSYDMTGILTIAGNAKHYIRPAFCLPQNTKLERKIEDNKAIYVVE